MLYFIILFLYLAGGVLAWALMLPQYMESKHDDDSNAVLIFIFVVSICGWPLLAMYEAVDAWDNYQKNRK